MMYVRTTLYYLSSTYKSYQLQEILTIYNDQLFWLYYRVIKSP